MAIELSALLRGYLAIGLCISVVLGFLCISDPESKDDRVSWAVVFVAGALWAIVLPIAIRAKIWSKTKQKDLPKKNRSERDDV